MLLGLTLSLLLNLVLMAGLTRAAKKVDELVEQKWRAENTIERLQAQNNRQYEMITALQDSQQHSSEELEQMGRMAGRDAAMAFHYRKKVTAIK